MKINAYVLVFGIVGIVMVAAGLSALTSYQAPIQATQGPIQATENVSTLPRLGRAPNFQGIVAWINSAPLNLSALKGRVVLVHFWTFSCINCIHMIPYLNAWYSKYGNDGLVIVGVHTPEFQFEKDYSNVLAAVRSDGIKYPVALDSNSATWNAYGNKAWPADYLIDKNGTIRYVHIGEGDYNATEMAIRGLLQNAGSTIVDKPVNGTGVTFSEARMSESYVRYDNEATPIANRQGFSPGLSIRRGRFSVQTELLGFNIKGSRAHMSQHLA